MNDLSVNGQFSTPETVRQAIEALLILREENKVFRNQFYISKTLGNQPATTACNLYKAIQNLKDQNFKKVASRWLSQGPFWEDERFSHRDDYFEFGGTDVTEQGLGEATRRKIGGAEVSSFSLVESGKNCEQTPLRIQHGLTEEIYGYHDILNIWNISTLKDAINASRPEPGNWVEFLKSIQVRFNETLIVADTACDELMPSPFSRPVVRRSIERLNVLSRLVNSRDAEGTWTSEGQALYDMHFHGDKAWFSDESKINKERYESEMTFPDPERPSEAIFCPWHGKINSSQPIRIHFEWPIPMGKKLKVLYIGPKITKG